MRESSENHLGRSSNSNARDEERDRNRWVASELDFWEPDHASLFCDDSVARKSEFGRTSETVPMESSDGDGGNTEEIVEERMEGGK